MAKRAASLDKTPEAYWSQIIERGARAFENYVITKMMEKGYQNDYLANVRPIEDFPRSRDRYPYLLPEEVAPIAQAFDVLFGTIQTKETDKGVMLFSKANTEPTGNTVSAINQSLKDEGLDKNNIKVVQSLSEADAKGLEDGRLSQIVYHGTPYRGIDKFSTDKMGTGEGFQAFGWGLYFAGKKDVAEYYRDTLKKGATVENVGRNDWRVVDPDGNVIRDGLAMQSQASNVKAEYDAKQGQLYEARIPDDEDMLLFGKPITAQSNEVKAILKDSGLWKELKENLSDYASPSNTRGKLNGENIYNYLEWKLGSPKAASQRLLALGIPGIKYAGGTISGVKNVGFNYVIFDGADTEITNTFYSRGDGQIQGFYNPKTNEITLVADGIPKGRETGVALHEIFHRGESNLTPDQKKALTDQVNRWKNRKEGSNERKIYEAATARAEASGDAKGEFLTYAIEEARNLGIEPNAKKGTISAEGWLAKVKQFFTAALEKLAPTYKGELNADDLVDIAYGIAAKDAEQQQATGDQTQTPAFKKWFGDSSVVDENGKPKIFYHDGSSEFTGIQSGKGRFGGALFVKEGGASGYGDASYALFVRGPILELDEMAELLGNEGGREILEKAARQKLDDDQAEQLTDALTNGEDYPTDSDVWDLIGAIDEADAQKEIQMLRGRVAKGLGFGAVRTPDEFGGQTVMITDPSQIKSATGNDGSFDPANPDIRYSRGETPDTKTEADAELKRYDEAVKRAKGYAGVLRAAADKLDNDAMATAAMRAAMPDITPVEIDDLLAQLRRQVQGLRGMARSARTMLGAEDQAGALQSEAMRAADMLANNLQMAAVIEKRNAALNMNVRLKASSFVNQFRDKGLDFEGFAALLVGSERVRTGSRVSVDAEYKGFRGEWVGGMIADVERMGLMREFISGEFDRDIYDALYRMGAGEKADLSNLPKQAVQLAEVVSKYQEDARNTRNRFGSWIRDLSGYITRQSHDMYKIREVSDADWIAFVKERVDLPKMMRLGLISESDPISSLRGMYDDFASGVHMKAVSGEEDGAAFGRGSNLAKRESVSRAIYFKDGLAAYEYNERFGTGRLAESVLFGLDQAARSTSLLKTLGTNPEATLTRLMDEYEATLAATPERRAKFREQRGALLDMLAQVDGSVNVPGNLTAAKVGSFLRSWQSMAKLGGALISSFSDLAGYGAELRYSQGKGLLSGVADGMARVMQGRAKDERAAIASSLGVFHESMAGAITARFDSPDLVGGKMAAAMQAFFRLNGLTWWTETLRDGAALSHSHYMATQAGRAFDKIDPEFQRMLQLYNIDAGKWDLLRMGQLQMADGRGYLTPEGLRTVPRAAFENYIQQVGRTVNDATVQNLMDDLSQALRVMTIDRAHHAVLEPSARTRAWMLRGTKPGTVPGEFLRYVGQFKSFSVSMVQSTLGREVYGRGYDSVGEYLKNGRGDMVGLAYMVGLYGLLGYGAMAAKDLLKGRTPRDPLDPRTMAAAMAQGGGLGLYGDFLFGEYSRMGRTFTASLAGPVIGNLDTLTDLWTRIRNGDDLAAASFKALIDNTPFLNLYWARPTLDYLVLYHIQEALNPGFLRRMEKRIERENGQSFVLPPSQVVR
jgi:hypothetical protein